MRCRRAGFDGVEVAAHMSYFLASFLSARKNVRTDEYGGSVENRARVLVNIVRLIREQAGASFPIGLRISANEHVDGGQGPDEYAAIAQVVEREGLDYVALSDGNYESMYRSAPETDAAAIEHGEAQVFRTALSCPLLLGSIHDPRRAAEAIADGHARRRHARPADDRRPRVRQQGARRPSGRDRPVRPRQRLHAPHGHGHARPLHRQPADGPREPGVR